MKDFLNSLGITLPGHFEGDNYIIELSDAEEYDKIFSKLDRREDVEEDEDSSIISMDSSSVSFSNEKFQLLLKANFESDEYQLVVSEKMKG